MTQRDETVVARAETMFFPTICCTVFKTFVTEIDALDFS